MKALALLVVVACSSRPGPELSDRGRQLVNRIREAADSPGVYRSLTVEYEQDSEVLRFKGDGTCSLAGMQGYLDEPRRAEVLRALVASGLLESAWAPLEDRLSVEMDGAMIRVRVPIDSELAKAMRKMITQLRPLSRPTPDTSSTVEQGGDRGGP